MRPLLLLSKGFYIPEGIVVTGNFVSAKEGGIAGTINGDVQVKAALTLEKNGVINGDLQATELIVRGKVNGSIYCQGKVSVLKDGIVTGNIFAGECRIDRLSIVKGVISHLNPKRDHESDIEISDASGGNLIPLIPEVVIPEEPPQTWF